MLFIGKEHRRFFNKKVPSLDFNTIFRKLAQTRAFLSQKYF